MCEYCKRNEYYMFDYQTQRVNVLDADLKVIKVLTFKEFSQRINDLEKGV